jgi:AcrR family transcriptional regulator
MMKAAPQTNAPHPKSAIPSPQSLYTERDLHEIWERQRFRRDGLLTEDAESVTVEFPGIRWGEGGPDFRGARLVVGGERRCGDVELHLTPSGWRAHGHRRDGAYASVILHVVLRRDPFSEPPRDPPLLVLEPYLHGAVAPAPGGSGEDLDALGEEWFAERRARMERALERAPGDEVLHREILVGLGYKHNKAAMAELARRCPLASLEGDAAAIGRRLRLAADALPRALWRLRNVRPANHPRRRLEEMARFLAEARAGGLARGLASRPTLEAMTAWLGRAGIGEARAAEIALNVFVPFLGPEAWRRIADGPPPRSVPGLVERETAGPVSTVRRYFGALRSIKHRV